MQACLHLGESNCEFHVGGFGEDNWHLDVGYDLSTVLEQLPDLLASLRGGIEGECDLYAQGIERTLRFVPEPDRVVIQCLSRTSWSPEPDTEIVALDCLEAMLVKLATDFSLSLEFVNPAMASMSPFCDWRSGAV